MVPLIRPFSENDIAEMSMLMADLGYPSTPGQVAERVLAMPENFYVTLVAVVDQRVVGFIGAVILPVYEYSVPIGWILALSVAEDFRRRGIGKALMASMEDALRSRGLEDVRLHSSLHRSEAHTFYENLGYDKTGIRFKKCLK